MASIAGLDWVAERAVKPQTSMTWERLELNVLELAGVMVLSDRFGAENSLKSGINAHITSEMASKVAEQLDQALLGGELSSAGSPSPTGLVYNSELPEMDLDAYDSDLGGNVLDMLGHVRGHGYSPNAILMDPATLHALLKVEDGNQRPKYPSLHSASPSLWGVSVIEAPNLPHETEESAGVPRYIVAGDFQKAIIGVMPMSLRTSDVATVGGESLFETDSYAIRWVFNVSSPLLVRPDAFIRMKVYIP